MNLNYIKIKNFRNLKDWKISFNKGLNVIVWPNSSWKTNFFSLLRFLDSLLLEWDIDKAFRKINKNILNISKEKSHAEIEVKINMNSRGVLQIKPREYGIINNKSFVLKISMKQLEGEVKITNFSWILFYKYINTNKNPSKYKPTFKWRDIRLEVLNSDYYYDNFKLVLNLFGEKNLEDAKIEFAKNQLKNIDDRWLTQDNLINKNFKQWYEESIGAFIKDRNFHFININPTDVRKPVSIGDISNIPNMLSENGNNLPFYLEKIFKDNIKKKEFNKVIGIDLPFISNIDTRYDDQTWYSFIIIKEWRNEVKPSWVSDWTIDYIAYLSLIIWYNPKENGGIFCIEEIERNLHFSLLNKLISRFKNELIENWVQMFITTHSMNLLNNVDPSEVFLLKKTLLETELLKLSTCPKIYEKIEIEGWLWNLFLENELEYNEF